MGIRSKPAAPMAACLKGESLLPHIMFGKISLNSGEEFAGILRNSPRVPLRALHILPNQRTVARPLIRSISSRRSGARNNSQRRAGWINMKYRRPLRSICTTGLVSSSARPHGTLPSTVRPFFARAAYAAILPAHAGATEDRPGKVCRNRSGRGGHHHGARCALVS